jgi:hypothetical protein
MVRASRTIDRSLSLLLGKSAAGLSLEPELLAGSPMAGLSLRPP